MTILQINKHYYPRDGTSVVMFNLSRLLERHGHRIVPFAMTQPENLPTSYAHSFVSQIKTEQVRFDWQGLRTAFRILYSFEAKRKIAKLIRLAKPEVAHFHNIYNQISPSIFAPLRRAKIPVVMSVHDWALISPNYNFFDHNEICERGLEHPWRIVKHRCVKDSLVASFWAALAFSFHHWFRFYERGVKKYIVPSQFVKDKLVAAGLSAEKIVLIPHFVEIQAVASSPEGDYLAYVGRLSKEKGVEVLLAAAKECPEVLIKIAGNGPEEKNLRQIIEKEGLKNVEMVGRLDGVARDKFYRHAAAVVVPSVCYETFGLTILEAYVAGKPVIASRLGALPEVVREGETGFLFEPGDSKELANLIRVLTSNEEARCRMGKAARLLVETEYNPELYYKRIMAVYQSVVE